MPSPPLPRVVLRPRQRVDNLVNEIDVIELTTLMQMSSVTERRRVEFMKSAENATKTGALISADCIIAWK